MSLPDTSPEVLRRWLLDTDRHLAEVADRLDPLLREQARLNEQRGHINGLLRSVLGEDESNSTNPVNESVRERVHREVVAILRDEGRPMHINDLHAEYLHRGYVVPGQGRPANITVHLAGWRDIASPTRGMYGLAELVGRTRVPRSSRPKGR